MRHPVVVLGLAAVLSAVTHGQGRNYSAPGRLVDVGGRNLHINGTFRRRRALLARSGECNN